MGFMEQFLGDKLQLTPVNPPSDLASGSSALNAETFLAQTNPDAINPMNGDRFVQKNMRTAPVCTEARGFTSREADAITQLAAANTHQAQHAVRAYRALGQMEHNDADVQTAHRGYLGKVAEGELRKVGANARLGQKLHSLRPGYAALGFGLNDADRSATNKVKIIKARITGMIG